MCAETVVKLQGAMIKIWECLDQEVLAEGPAGTAKTRTILEALDFIARKYAKARILIIRKTRMSMTHSVMATFERFVQRLDVHFHTTDQAYRYPNGSIMAVGGMDNPAKILSSEWDVIYWNEATEGTENEWETLSTRLRGGVVPYQQMIADCNPDTDSHWLNQRAATNKMTRIVTRHEDNPRYWNADKGEYTPEGERYVKGVLDKLSGVRLLRYRKGIWASREGLVYDGFDRSTHVIRRDQLPVLQTRFRAIDFGFSNPFVCQWWGLDNDGRMYLYKEIYFTQRTVKVHSEQINILSGGETISNTVSDHDAEDRATLQENGIDSVGAKKAIRPGIDAVIERLKIQDDGKPRLFVVEDALVEEDRSLRERGLPLSTLEEFTSYAWPTSKPDRNDKEVPVDAYNHGCLVAETLIDTPQGDKWISDIRVGDLVMGRNGWVRVTVSAMTQARAQIYGVRLANGRMLFGTHDHPVWTENRGYIQINALRYGDLIRYNTPTERGELCSKSHIEKAKQKLSFTKGLSFAGIQNQNFGAIGFTSSPISYRGATALIAFIANSTKTLLGRFLKDARFTTRTGTRSTTLSATLSAYQRRFIANYTKSNIANRGGNGGENGSWRRFIPRRNLGINPMMVARGIGSMAELHLASVSPNNTNASIAAPSLKAKNFRIPTTVLINVNQRRGEQAALITSIEYVPDVDCHSLPINTASNNFALVPVEAVLITNERSSVYNLTVEGGEYYANRILVHNCDALRYAVAYVDGFNGMSNDEFLDLFSFQQG